MPVKRKLVALAVLLVGLAGFWALLGGEEGASVFLSQPMPGPLAGRVIRRGCRPRPGMTAAAPAQAARRRRT